jgi:cysteine synthase A
MIYKHSRLRSALPVVKLHRIPPKHVTIYAKVEAFNPLSSVKDRLAFAIIDDAERRRHLEARPDRRRRRRRATPASRSRWCARRAIRSLRRWSDAFSVERRKIMRALGAKVILTPAAGRGTGMVRLAAALAGSTAGFSRANSRIRPTRLTTGRRQAPRS